MRYLAVLLLLGACDRDTAEQYDSGESGFAEAPECCSEDDCAPLLCVDGLIFCPPDMEPTAEPYWCAEEDS